MSLGEILRLIKPEWRSAFQEFIKTGEADDAFLDYLDNDETAQEAVEKAFNRQVRAFEELAANLSQTTAELANEDRTATVSEEITAALEEASELTPEQQELALRAVQVKLESSLGSDVRDEVKSSLSQLCNAIRSRFKLGESG